MAHACQAWGVGQCYMIWWCKWKADRRAPQRGTMNIYGFENLNMSKTQLTCKQLFSIFNAPLHASLLSCDWQRRAAGW